MHVHDTIWCVVGEKRKLKFCFPLLLSQHVLPFFCFNKNAFSPVANKKRDSFTKVHIFWTYFILDTSSYQIFSKGIMRNLPDSTFSMTNKSSFAQRREQSPLDLVLHKNWCLQKQTFITNLDIGWKNLWWFNRQPKM